MGQGTQPDVQIRPNWRRPTCGFWPSRLDGGAAEEIQHGWQAQMVSSGFTMDLPPPIARLKTLAIGDGQLVIHGGLASFQEVLSPLVPCTICTQSASPSQELCSVVSIHLKCAGCIWLLQIHSLNLASLSVRSSLGRLAAATVA